ncbi:MAG: alcohol dehydrogenase catalytic domain-containing protein [Spirochaetota bacterium]
MKAAVFTGVQQLQVTDIPYPECGDGEVILKVASCGICGSDLRNFKVGLRHGVERQVMGHEFSGEVVEVGKNVSGYSKGDRVAGGPDVTCGSCYYCRRCLNNLCVNHKMLGTHWPGAFAEYIKLPSIVLQRGTIHHIPQGLSLDRAALAEPCSSVLASQKNACVSLEDTVLIFGDGPMGCVHLEVARARGASRIIIVGLDRLDEAARFEPDYLIDASSRDPVEEVLNITGGLGADKAICAVPVAQVQQQAVKAVRKRGIIILFGGLPKSDPMTSLDSNTIHYNEINLMGAFSYPPTAHEEALRILAEEKVHPDKIFTRILPLDRIEEGFRLASEGKELKVLIKPWLKESAQ